MDNLPQALQGLAQYNQFILWTTTKKDGKTTKFPVDHRTASVGDAHDPSIWMSADVAMRAAHTYGPNYGVGFVFTKDDPFFFIDIDKCLNPDNATWSPVAVDLMSKLPGAAVEVSQSGRGLHIFGKSSPVEHGCKNISLGLEMYTSGRFVALTGANVVGDCNVDMSAYLTQVVSQYFAPTVAADMEWTDAPVPEWSELSDDEIVEKAKGSQNAASAFQGKSTFQALWECDADILAQYYPDLDGSRDYDGSSADAALAQHLAFWTGKNCEHIKSLMLKSGLVRDKWEREDYLFRTIIRAVSLQVDVYSVGKVDTSVPDMYGAVTLKGSKAQKDYAISIRARKMAQVAQDTEMCKHLAAIPSAKIWIDNQHLEPALLVERTTQVQSAPPPMMQQGPELVSGYQYLGVTQQLEYFAGCVYIQNAHKILTPSGTLLKSEQFNASYGGYIFQLDENGDKVTRKAWEAFTESQIIRFPKASDTCFRPDLPTGEIISHEGLTQANTYVEIGTTRLIGDVSPFLTHLAKLLPVEHDRDIILAYMAACVQHKGVKFQWTPLLQGTEGNGKTLLTRCVAFAIGERYTHLPPAHELTEKFNGWLFNTLFIGVEDVYVPDNKKEVIEIIKPMITNNRLAKREMQQTQITDSVCANFMLNSNHKDAIRKTKSDRRFAVFYTAQQDEADLVRDGMDGDYFPKLYKWLNDGGYAVVNEYLNTYGIPDALNPAKDCHRAPATSSTDEAVRSSMGSIEQCIIEAVEECRPGFAGDWISSVALNRLLEDMRMGRAIAHNKRKDLLAQLGYVYHPALRDGRVGSALGGIDENKKSRLFIKKGSLKMQIQKAAEVARIYRNDQCQGDTSKAEQTFSSAS